jgi:hypothetical protein
MRCRGDARELQLAEGLSLLRARSPSYTWMSTSGWLLEYVETISDFLSIFESRRAFFDGLESTVEEVLAKLLETGTREGYVEVDTLEKDN